MSLCYDISQFHPACGNKQLVSGVGGKCAIYCPTCGIVADLEAIAAKVSPSDSCKVQGVGLKENETRQIVGDQSPNVDRGGFKQ